MIEEVLSNETVTDTVTDKKPSFYAPKSCVLNMLAQTYTPKNLPPASHGPDQVLLGEPTPSCKLCPWHLRRSRNAWTREPRQNLSEWIMNLQNQSTALLCSGSQRCTERKLRCCRSEYYHLPAWQKKLSKYTLVSYHADHYMTSGLRYNDDKKGKHFSELLFGDSSWTHLLYISFVSLLLITLGHYQDVSHLWPLTIKPVCLQIGLGFSYLVSH